VVELLIDLIQRNIVKVIPEIVRIWMCKIVFCLDHNMLDQLFSLWKLNHMDWWSSLYLL